MKKDQKLTSKMIVSSQIYTAECPKCGEYLTSNDNNLGSQDIPFGSDGFCYYCDTLYKFPENSCLNVTIRKIT